MRRVQSEPFAARGLNAAAPAGNEASALDWDTVFAVPYDRINSAIASEGKYPKTMDFAQTTGAKLAMKADFGPWQLVPKGDGATVRVSLPMTGMTGSYFNAGTPVTFDCDDLTGVIEIHLDLLPDDPVKPLAGFHKTPLPLLKPGTKRHKLVVSTTPQQGSKLAATYVGMDFVKPLSNPVAQLYVEMAFQLWCNANLAAFEHVFAVIDLNDQIATGQWAFCKPHTASYACVDSLDGKSGLFALLCMTSSDPVPSIQQVTHFAVPPGGDAGFLVRNKRFMLDLLQTALINTWTEMTADKLELSSGSQLLQMKANEKVTLPQFPVTAKDGTQTFYTPILDSFSVEIETNILRIDMHTDVEVSPGIHATCKSTYWSRIKLGTNTNGDQTLVYESAQTPSITHGHYHDDGITIIKDILEVIGAVLALLSMLVGDEAGLVVAGLLVTALIGDYAIGDIENTHQNDGPSLGDFQKNFTSPVIWTGTKHLDLTSAGLAGSLQLGGLWKG